MATTVKVLRWDDQRWDDEGNSLTIAVNDTFTVSNIDQNNKVVTLAPGSTSYPSNLLADTWDDSTFWSDGTLANHFTQNQTFTVLSLDYNNRIVTLSG